MSAPPAYTEPLNGAYTDWEDTPDYKYSFEKPEKPVPAPAYDDAFPIETPRYNDTFFTYTFIATILGLSYMTYSAYVFDPQLVTAAMSTSDMSKGMKALYTLIGVSTLTPLAFSAFLLGLVYLFPMAFVLLGFLLAPLTMFGMAITSLMAGAIFPAILSTAFGCFLLAFMFQNYSRFSFSALMLKLVIAAMAKYPSTFFISMLSSLITAAIAVGYMVSMALIVNARAAKDDTTCPHTNGGDVCVSNTTIAILLFVVFSGCYIFQVLQNTVHVTLAGVFSSWYFLDTYDGNQKPRHPALGAMKRALTYCFGSICFGSLLVSIVQTIRISLQMLKSKLQNARHNRDNDNDFGSGDNGLLLCALICVVSVLEWIASEFEYWMQWFNRYAYSYLAMYGKPYLQSARDTFEILKYKGIDILINDSLISTAISLYSILAILVSAGVLALVFNANELLKEMGPEMLVIGGVGSLITCWFIVSSAINVLDVGCVTFMVGLAVDPDAFTRTNAAGASEANIRRLQFWEQMVRYYPGVRDRVTIDWPETTA